MGAPGSQPGPGGDRPGPSGPRSSQVTGAQGGSGRSRDPVRLADLGSDHGTDHQGGQPHRMLRLLHTADVHLGARHADLGEAAAAQRERQFAAFRATVDLAIAEKVDLFLVAGDLFDSNVQPKRSVERVAAELARLAQARIRSVLVPGHPRRLRPLVGLPRLRHRGHGRDPPRRGDGHRPHAGSPVGPPRRRSTPSSTAPASRPSARRTARCTTSPPSRRPTPPGASASSTRPSPSPAAPTTTRSSSRSRRSPRAASTTSRSATGTPRRSPRPRASPTPTPGRPSRSPSTRTRPARCSCVTLDVDKTGQHTVEVDQRVVGKTTFERREIDAATVGSQPALVAKLMQGREPGPRPRRPADRRPARRARPRHRPRSSRRSGRRTCGSACATSATRR